MRCPYCSHPETQVKDSRASEDGTSIRRRRVCAGCGSRFTTLERISLRDLTVVKSDGREEVFDSEKLVRSLKLACQKRPITFERIEQIATGIQRNLESLGDSHVPSSVIGQLALDALENLDSVAFVRFASVYKNFKSLEDFQRVLNKQTISSEKDTLL